MKCGVLVLGVSSLLATAPVLADDATLQNLQHGLLVREALAQDPLLAPLRILTRVDKRIAYLWGPVPSAELATHAVARIKELPELVDVRSELHVEKPEDPSAVPRPAQRPALTTKSGEPAENGQRPANPTVGFFGMVSLAPPDSKVEDKKPAPKEPRSAFDANEGIVLPTIRVPAPTGMAPASQKDGVPSVTPSASPSTLTTTVQQLQQSEQRYRRITVAVNGGVVTLSGIVMRWDDMHALARTIARLPGVERVVLNSIRVDPSLR